MSSLDVLLTGLSVEPTAPPAYCRGCGHATNPNSRTRTINGMQYCWRAHPGSLALSLRRRELKRAASRRWYYRHHPQSI
jgi:hypothetical protein